MTLTIRKLEEHIGAEVQGVDITSPIDAETFDKLRGALCEYAVLVFHDQDITDEQHVVFSEGFGPLEMTMANDPIGDGGPIGVISNLDENGEIIPPEDSTDALYRRQHALALGWLVQACPLARLAALCEGHTARRG